MKQLIESGAARIASGIQGLGANFDFEVLSLPDGRSSTAPGCRLPSLRLSEPRNIQ